MLSQLTETVGSQHGEPAGVNHPAGNQHAVGSSGVATSEPHTSSASTQGSSGVIDGLREDITQQAPLLSPASPPSEDAINARATNLIDSKLAQGEYCTAQQVEAQGEITGLFTQARFEDLTTQRDFYRAALQRALSITQRLPEQQANEARSCIINAANASLLVRQPEQMMDEAACNTLMEKARSVLSSMQSGTPLRKQLKALLDEYANANPARQLMLRRQLSLAQERQLVPGNAEAAALGVSSSWGTPEGEASRPDLRASAPDQTAAPLLRDLEAHADLWSKAERLARVDADLQRVQNDLDQRKEECWRARAQVLGALQKLPAPPGEGRHQQLHQQQQGAGAARVSVLTRVRHNSCRGSIGSGSCSSREELTTGLAFDRFLRDKGSKDQSPAALRHHGDYGASARQRHQEPPSSGKPIWITWAGAQGPS